MNSKQLRKKLAYLEFVNDQLTAELHYVDDVMRTVGFSDGLHTVKSAAEELINQNKKMIKNNDNHSEII